MTDKAWERKVAAELERIGAGGAEEPTPGLPLGEVRFRASSDGRLAQFSRKGCPKTILARHNVLPALKKVRNRAGVDAAWRALNLACE